MRSALESVVCANDWLKLRELFLGEAMWGCLVRFHGRILKLTTYEYWIRREEEMSKERCREERER